MGGVPGTKEGSESWTTVGKCTSAHHRRGPQRPLQAGGPAQHAFRILQGDGSWPRVGGKRARAGRVRGGDTRPPEGGGQRGGGRMGRGRLAALQAQNHKLGRLRRTERGRPWAQGDAVGTTDRRGDGAGGWVCSSQTVHPEGVLGGRVGQDHVGVIEHVQSVQGQGVNLEFVQGELVVGVEADITDPSQCAGQFFRQAGRGLSRHWKGRDTGRTRVSAWSWLSLPMPCTSMAPVNAQGRRAWATPEVLIWGFTL